MIGRIYDRLSSVIRTKWYSLKYEVGKNCSFGDVKFWRCEENSIKIGDKVTIFRGTELCAHTRRPIVIGDNTFINQRCIIRPNTSIGNNVSVGQNVMMVTDSHEIGNEEKRAGTPYFPKISIGDGCWIGANSTLY